MKPIRKYYISSHFLPSMKKLTALVDRERHLVLSFPAWSAIAKSTTKKEVLIESLKNNVPENFNNHHGQHFCCQNLGSGQIVEVPIWFGVMFEASGIAYMQ